MHSSPPLPTWARVYVAAVTVAGALVFALCLPGQLRSPFTFVLLFAASLGASTLKVQLPLDRSGATMSVAYVIYFLSLLLLGPHETMLFVVVGAWMQARIHARGRTEAYRIAFSMAVIALTIQAAGLVYQLMGGRIGDTDVLTLPKPVVAAATAYFFLNSVLVAVAIALSTRQSIVKVWHGEFLWSAPSYFVGAGVATLTAVLLVREGFWLLPLMGAPVYLTYRSYKVYLGRVDDDRQKILQAHEQAVEALASARKSEQALAAEKEHLSVTLRSIGDGVITTDVQGRILMLNEAAETFTGWSQQDAAGRPLSGVLRLVDRVTKRPYENPVGKVLETQVSLTRDGNASLVSRDGTERLIEESAAPIRDNDGSVIGVVLVFRDVTDAVHLQEERLKASKLASLGVLAGGIAHDFNNILTAIVGNLALARMEEGINADAAAIIGEAEKACLRAKGLTRQLLTFSKGGAPVKAKLKIDSILRDATTFALRGSNVKCEFEIAGDLAVVEADEGQINQVISNLVINAQQAMPKGGVLRVRAANALPDRLPRAHALSAVHRAYVEFSVEDSGVGIPEENLSKIFDPYFTTKETGNGLGLATTYSIVKNHEGYMSMQSEMGVGTTVHVYLPASADQLSARDASRMNAQTQKGKGRVLLLDDDEMVSKVGKKMLTRLGYEVRVASEGGQAIDMYREAREHGAPFDVVIMDLTIPGGLGGKEAIVQLREMDPDIKAIVSSGYADDPVMAEFRRHGFAGVMPKPFTPQELSKSLHGVLG